MGHTDVTFILCVLGLFPRAKFSLPECEKQSATHNKKKANKQTTAFSLLANDDKEREREKK